MRRLMKEKAEDLRDYASEVLDMVEDVKNSGEESLGLKMHRRQGEAHFSEGFDKDTMMGFAKYRSLTESGYCETQENIRTALNALKWIQANPEEAKKSKVLSALIDFDILELIDIDRQIRFHKDKTFHDLEFGWGD